VEVAVYEGTRAASCHLVEENEGPPAVSRTVLDAGVHSAAPVAPTPRVKIGLAVGACLNVWCAGRINLTLESVVARLRMATVKAHSAPRAGARRVDRRRADKGWPGVARRGVVPIAVFIFPHTLAYKPRLWCAFEILAVGEDTTVLGDVKDCGMRSMVGRKGVENTPEDWALLVRDARVNWLGKSGPTGSGSGQGTACRAHPDNGKDGQ
jgi:hypothetical protein